MCFLFLNQSQYKQIVNADRIALRDNARSDIITLPSVRGVENIWTSFTVSYERPNMSWSLCLLRPLDASGRLITDVHTSISDGSTSQSDSASGCKANKSQTRIKCFCTRVNTQSEGRFQHDKTEEGKRRNGTGPPEGNNMQ